MIDEVDGEVRRHFVLEQLALRAEMAEREVQPEVGGLDGREFFPDAAVERGDDADAMAGFFEQLQSVVRTSDSRESMPDYLRTHPVTTTRISEARDRARGSSTTAAPAPRPWRMRRRSRLTAIPSI